MKTKHILMARSEMQRNAMGSEGWWKAFDRLRKLEQKAAINQ